jgi:nucleolar protein 12
LNSNTTKIGDNFITVQRLGKTTFDTDVTVFVGNLTPEIQENQIRDFFSDCGKIQGVRVIRDKQTGIGKGIAFVSFYSNDGVILALEKKGVNFCGRSIRIMKAGIQKKKLTKQEIKSNARNAKRRKMNQGKLRNDGQGDEKKSFKGGDGKVEKSIKKEKQSRSFSGTKTSAMQNKSGKRSLKKSKVNKKKKKLNEKKKITKILTA